MAKLLYNPIMARWMGMSEDKSVLFKGAYSDYDDPTYMTFRLEFGDWGASVLDRSVLQKGVSIFSAKSLNYDQLPMGLLNCPEPDNNDDTYWYNSKSTFNDTENYSAFSYLRSRNEDVRAQYLFGFVNGLYELQKETPYMFKSIAGLQNLDKVNSTDGQRIKKDQAKLTVSCYEGIALKVRTLLELYKKAAWDEVYQRWILPENMREFKMIVYIFERRTFHKASEYKEGSGMMMLSNDDDLNLDVPVKVFECAPCEFDISGANWEDSLVAAHSGEAVPETKLIINVKNVKTYFKNGLLTSSLGLYNFDKLLIYDLVDGLEKISASEISDSTNTSSITNKTLNEVKSLFMNKKVLLENEDMHEKYYEYIQGYGAAGAFAKGGTNDQKLAEALSVLNADTATIKENGSNRQAADADKSGVAIEEARDSWQDTAFGVNLLASTASLIKSLVYGVTGVSLEHKPSSKATNNGTVKKQNFTVTYKDKTLAEKIAELQKGTSLKDKGDALVDLSPLVFNVRSNVDVALSTIEAPRQTPVLDIPDMSNPRDLPELSFTGLNDTERTYSTEIVTDIESNYTKPTLQQQNIEDPRESADYVNTQMDRVRKLPEEQMASLDDARKTSSWSTAQIEGERELPEEQMTGLNEARTVTGEITAGLESPTHVTQTEITDTEQEARSIDTAYAQPVIEEIAQSVKKLDKIIINARELSNDAAPVKFDESAFPSKDIENVVFAIRNLPELEEVTIEDVKKLSTEDFGILIESVKKIVPEYTINSQDLIQAIETVKTEPTKAFIDLEKSASAVENETFDILKANTALQNIEQDKTKADKLENLLAFTKVLSKNSDEIKATYVKKLSAQRQALKTVTTHLVNSLPAAIVTGDIKERDIKDKKIKISFQDLKQIGDNIALIGLEDTTFESMSLQNIIQLSTDFDKQIDSTKNITGLSNKFSARKKNSKAEAANLTNVKKPRQKRLGHIELESMREKKKNTTKFETF